MAPGTTFTITFDADEHNHGIKTMVPVAVDTTGDGIADAVGMDTTGDGQIDSIDFSGDGSINIVKMDTTGDGKRVRFCRHRCRLNALRRTQLWARILILFA